MPTRVPLEKTAEEHAEDEAFLALYGPWAPLGPAELARELAGFDRPWWVVGGWAIEAATGYRREHEDTDISLLVCDVPAFVELVRDRWHVWNNVGGVLHPLGGRWRTVDEPASQLWLRADATSPWVVDIPLTPDVDGLWSNKFLDGHVAPWEQVTWRAADGIHYLRPEIVLAYKARLRRPKDEPDFAATLPVLDDRARAWLRTALGSMVPDHPWLDRL
ncbi:hypothetical protein [Nocardioides sp. T2.26MG-1]|uniref:hypothetical protein n=1 Tax=Nocardioides sp. T2.26MG-1 TaxID=3041166 RepID=UPI002477A26C|nr:hypothetical protein [Nocardioides sp. T2.26MG-1]CAI9418803.1 hypothetical protein HIDPHFAB_03400 [Nocardioides sp. T2.26MG-1]